MAKVLSSVITIFNLPSDAATAVVLTAVYFAGVLLPYLVIIFAIAPAKSPGPSASASSAGPALS